MEELVERPAAAPLLLVGEAAGFRGARVSGLPFTSERQLAGTGPAGQTATIVHAAPRELGLEEQVLLSSAAGGRASAVPLADEDLHRQAGRDPA